MPDANTVLANAVAFRGQLDDIRLAVLQAIDSSGGTDLQKQALVGQWGSLVNAADAAISDAQNEIFAANASQLAEAQASIKAASDQLTQSQQSLDDIAKTLNSIAQAVSVFGQAISFLHV